MTPIKDMIEKPHPVYTRYVRYWDFLLNSYEGGIDYTNAMIPFDTAGLTNDVIPVYANGELITAKQLSNNLFRHPKERDDHFNDRVNMSYYYNFCQPVIDIYTEHLFKQSIVEDWGSIEDLIERRGENIDRRGSSLHEFRKEAADMSQTYGHCFALVDMPKSQNEINLEQRIINDQFAYVSLLPPQKIINWSLDRFGRAYWIVVCESADVNIDHDNYDKAAKGGIQYRLWDRNSWYLFDGDHKLIEDGFHGLGFVPIVPIYDRPSKKAGYLGISSISDISFIARDIYNLCSELTQIIRDQTFAFLALQGDATDYQGDNSIGTRKGLIYPRETNAPQYIAPPKDNAEVVMSHIEKQIDRIYKLAKLGGGSGQQVEQVNSQSGISKAFDFQQTNSSLSRKASNLNDAELKIWQMFAAWEGREFEGSVLYPDEFSVQAVNDDISEAIQMNKLAIGKLAKIETNKAILQKKFPRLPDDQLEKIIKDMESAVNSESTQNQNAFSIADRLRQRQTAEAGDRT